MRRIALVALLFACVPFAEAQPGRAAATPADLRGVYQAIPNGATLAGGRKNEGSPSDIVLLPAMAQQMKAVNLKEDPAKMCQPVGPFRMMAREAAKVELVPATGMVVMLFEDLSRGLMRTIYMTRAHPKGAETTWMGDSTGRWEGDTLVVDTVGFNDRTWLNDQGAQHSDALHLVERIRPILSGKYLEYRVTAEDSKALAKPYSYTRYYEKLKTEVMEDSCEDEP
jgi:hypothetical protein